MFKLKKNLDLLKSDDTVWLCRLTSVPTSERRRHCPDVQQRLTGADAGRERDQAKPIVLCRRSAAGEGARFSSFSSQELIDLPVDSQHPARLFDGCDPPAQIVGNARDPLYHLRVALRQLTALVVDTVLQSGAHMTPQKHRHHIHL